MDDEELLETIEQARLAKVTRLDLSNKGLTSVPREIAQLTNLQYLSLYGNQLTSVPPEIAQLTNLQTLYLYWNRLTSVPPEIGELANLQTLDLEGNQLTSAPPEIAQLTNLQTLGLGSNQLTSVPPEVAELTSLRSLVLGSNQLTSVPPEIAGLSNLQNLELSSNRLASVPPEIAGLSNLQSLNLGGNQLTPVPPEIARLTSLQSLLLWGNQLTSVPPEIAQLTNLRSLYLNTNQLTSVPPEIARLSSLETLWLQNNQLTSVPPEIEQLSNLRTLRLNDNQLTSLPREMAGLTNLQELDLDGNPLMSPPPEVVAQGTEAVLAFFREQLKEGTPQWVSKLLLVGEGGVGKTQLLRALRGEPFEENAPKTPGIDIRPVELEHPAADGVTMQLNAWDFGGQEIYHATHQFFLSERSLFLLVWNARHGYEQGKLDTIQAKAPDSPVLIVAAHADQHPASLPLQDTQRKYPQVLGHYEVSNRDGTGIPELRERLREVAADLPLLGEEWPAAWFDAANAVRAIEERYVTVVLDPQWVTGYIYRVLENKAVIERDGVFQREDMAEVWADLDSHMQGHFLRLMERFDLSYRTLENRDISIVVECLSLDPPGEMEPGWDEISERTAALKEVSMRFDLKTTLPAGVPTWFIARQHRFTTHTHWLYGALLADGEERRHLALVRAFPHDRYLQLTVRGPYPHNFFALLRDGLELTLARFAGLRIDRSIPCPGHDGAACDYTFDLRRVEGALERERITIECQESFEQVSVPRLLFGLHWTADSFAVSSNTESTVFSRLDELERNVTGAVGGARDEILAEQREVRELLQRGFTTLFTIEQEKPESHCPNVFALEPVGASAWRQRLVGQKMTLHLYCQQPGQWHPTVKGGRYEIDKPAEWLNQAAPYVSRLVSVLKYTTPVLGPWLGVAAPDFEKMFKNQLDLMKALVGKLPEVTDDPELRHLEAVERAGHGERAERAAGGGLRALRQLLDEKDSQHGWGDLRRTLTPEGPHPLALRLPRPGVPPLGRLEESERACYHAFNKGQTLTLGLSLVPFSALGERGHTILNYA